MPDDLDSAIRRVVESVAAYAEQIATLTVETRYIEEAEAAEAGADFDKARPLARTEIKFDGDNYVVLPMRRTNAGALEVSASVRDIHERNVQTALEYRARIVSALLEALQSRIR